MTIFFTILRLLLSVLTLAAPVALTGCGALVASTDIKGARHNLNEAVTVTAEEQLLLALVQTRFVHNPGFLEVSAINTQLKWSAGISGSYQTNPSIGSVAPSLGYSETPTITYIPLQGPKFVRQIMTPVSAEIVGLILETGWSCEVVLRLEVERNGEVHFIAGSEGQSFDWEEMYKDLLTIHWSPSRPEKAAIVVNYQNIWYYVNKNDVASKQTFVLLAQLTKMLSGLGSGNAPALTLRSNNLVKLRFKEIVNIQNEDNVKAGISS